MEFFLRIPLVGVRLHQSCPLSPGSDLHGPDFLPFGVAKEFVTKVMEFKSIGVLLTREDHCNISRKAFDLPVELRFAPHLWSWASGNN